MDFRSALIILILAPDVYFPVRNAASLFHASEDGVQALQELNRLTAEITPQLSSSEEIVLFGEDSISWSAWNFAREDGSISLFPAAQAKSGEMVFITGSSGVGKTTFAMNLLGATSNSVSWQKNMGWIPQNPQLAAGTLREQFQLIDPSATDEKILDVLSFAGLDIKELSHGLDTQMGFGGEQGHSASGGQIRRIAIARALFGNPKVVIADEPTADLDSETSALVMQSLRQVQKRWRDRHMYNS